MNSVRVAASSHTRYSRAPKSSPSHRTLPTVSSLCGGKVLNRFLTCKMRSMEQEHVKKPPVRRRVEKPNKQKQTMAGWLIHVQFAHSPETCACVNCQLYCTAVTTETRYPTVTHSLLRATACCTCSLQKALLAIAITSSTLFHQHAYSCMHARPRLNLPVPTNH